MIFTKRFNELLKDNGTRQTELAEYCNLSKQAVTEMKNGRSYPSLDTLCKIADFFEVSTDYLLGRTDI